VKLIISISCHFWLCTCY